MMRPHVVFAGGGTGGHLFPGLAVARQLQSIDRAVRITFAGSGRTFEREHVTAAGYEYLTVRAQPAPRHARTAVRFFLDNLAGYIAAREFLRRGVDLVVGMGGYVSAPTARAAVSLRLPFVLLEANAVAGRVNRWLAPSATLLCAAFAEARSTLQLQGGFCLTGHPIRDGFASGSVPPTAREKLLVVLGGSQGAHSLNVAVPRALAALRDALIGWQVVHQAGASEAEATTALYRSLGVAAHVTPFLDDLPLLVKRASLAITRAGGGTLAELAAVGVPAVVCPYAFAADDHQRKNAQVLASAGACVLVDERHSRLPLTGQLTTTLATLIGDEPKRRLLSAAVSARARTNAAKEVAELVCGVIDGAQRESRRSKARIHPRYRRPAISSAC